MVKNKELRIRNEYIRDGYLSGKTMEQVAEDTGLSKERVRQILLSDFGIKGREQIKARNDERAEKIRQVIDANPEISVTEVAEKLGYDRNLVQKLITEHDIWVSGNFKSTEKWTLAIRQLEIGESFEATYSCKFPRQNFYSKAKSAGIKISTVILSDNKAIVTRIE